MTSLGRAELLRIVTRLPRDEWAAAARAAGYEPLPERPKPKPDREPDRPPPRPPDTEDRQSPVSYSPADLPDLAFWRIAAERPLTAQERAGNAPVWLERTKPWKRLPLADTSQAVPVPAELAPAARRARFLRQVLAAPAPGRALDLPRLCRQLAEGRVAPHLPRRRRPLWPGRVYLVIDLSQSLRPFHDDLWGWSLLLERGLPPRLARPPRIPPPGVPASDRAPDRVPGDAHAQPIAPSWQPACKALLAALADGARTEPALLRRLRLLFNPLGADIGWEHAVWNHPAVVADELACALRPDCRGEAEGDLANLPPTLRRAIARARERGNAHLSPLVRLEEALAAGPWAAPGAYREALTQARLWAVTLHRGDCDSLRQQLAAAIAGLGRRRPGLLARHRELAAAWATARRAELDAGTLKRLPPGLDLDDLAWLLDPSRPRRAAYLGQRGETLGLYSADADRPACRLAESTLDGDYWEVETLTDAPAATPWASGAAELATNLATDPDAPSSAHPPTRVLRLGEAVTLAPAQRHRIIAGDRQLELEAVRRPSWAAGLGRDGQGLFAELSQATHGGRRLYWMPRYRLRVDAGASAALELPAGAWWDADLHRAWLQDERVLGAPHWAERHGADAAGRWAEFTVEGVEQRMRWLPPGEFLMGSPEDERERDSDEIQHRVILTQGLWLADTACTQALWQAVMGENPSGFEGPEQPVERVSWEDVVERFLPALDARVPGLDARLPTEAEWEYACRAGTETPFSFGETVTTDQVNYDGNFPYGGGAKGEYREQTVDVKALPANPWGLYQMHGNVYEWCADWQGDYPREVTEDPTGPSAGRGRVLRGGRWRANAGWCRSADRGAGGPGSRYRLIGFRLARGSSPRQAGQGGGAGEAGVVPEGGASATTPATPAPGPGKG